MKTVAVRLQPNKFRKTLLLVPITLSACATIPLANSLTPNECDSVEIIRNLSGNAAIPVSASSSKIEIDDGEHIFFPSRGKSFPRPTFPAEMRSLGLSGEVKLSVTVDELGSVISMRTLYATNECFEKSAVETIRRSEFYPAMLDGVEQVSTIVLPITFRLSSF